MDRRSFIATTVVGSLGLGLSSSVLTSSTTNGFIVMEAKRSIERQVQATGRSVEEGICLYVVHPTLEAAQERLQNVWRSPSECHIVRVQMPPNVPVVSFEKNSELVRMHPKWVGVRHLPVYRGFYRLSDRVGPREVVPVQEYARESPKPEPPRGCKFFVRGQVLGRNQLSLHFKEQSDVPVEVTDIHYELYDLTSGADRLITPQKLTPVHPVLGEYYASATIPWSANVGDHRINWHFHDPLSGKRRNLQEFFWVR